MTLPPVIEAFVQGKNSHDSGAVVACFTQAAVVQDEGQDIHGQAAIKQWLDASIAKYSATMSVLKFTGGENQIVLTAEVAGTFEGSPVPLDFHFTLKDGKIDRLYIELAEAGKQ